MPVNIVILTAIVMIFLIPKFVFMIAALWKWKPGTMGIALFFFFDIVLIMLLCAFTFSDPQQQIESKISKLTELTEESIAIYQSRKLEDFLSMDEEIIDCLSRYEDQMKSIFKVEYRELYDGVLKKWVKLYLTPACIGGEPIQFTYGKDNLQYGKQFSKGDYVYYPPDSNDVRTLSSYERTILEQYLKLCKEARSFTESDFNISSSKIMEKIVANQMEALGLLKSMVGDVGKEPQTRVLAETKDPEKIEYGDGVGAILRKIEHLLVDSRYTLNSKEKELRNLTGLSELTQISSESLIGKEAEELQRIDLLLKRCNGLKQYITSLESLKKELQKTMQIKALAKDTAEFHAERQAQEDIVLELVKEVESHRLRLKINENFLESALISGNE